MGSNGQDCSPLADGDPEWKIKLSDTLAFTADGHPTCCGHVVDPYDSSITRLHYVDATSSVNSDALRAIEFTTAPLPSPNYVRVKVGQDLVIMDKQTRVVLDIAFGFGR